MTDSEAKLLETFSDDTWFLPPLGRELSFRSLEDWLKTKLPPLGGAVTAATPFRTYLKICRGYESAVVLSITTLLQKDVGAAQSLCSASGKSSSKDLGPGYLHWTSYYCTGASGLSQQRKLQSAFGRPEKEDKKVVGWLQDLTDDVLLYHVEKLVSPAMRTRVAREWQRHEFASQKAQPSGGGAQKTIQRFRWKHAKACIGKDLPDQDVRTVTDAVASIIRSEGGQLLSWTQVWLTLQILAARLEVSYPNAHWCKQFLGQVSSQEIRAGQLDVPTSKSEMATFDITEFEDQVLALAQDTLPRAPIPPGPRARPHQHVAGRAGAPSQAQVGRQARDAAR